MAEHSTIEWTDATWNPVTGCTMVSAGCTNCYAMGLAATRLRHHPSRQGLTRESGGRAVWTGEVRLNEGWLDQPLRWTKPRHIFVCAHGDLFHEAVPDEWIDRVFAVMALAPQHTFQVLTKRPERMRRYMAGFDEGGRFHEGMRDALVEGSTQALYAARTGENPSEWLAVSLPLPNVWLGTSVEDQATADARIPHLLATPAVVRFVSAEPLLGPVDLFAFMHDSDCVEQWRDTGFPVCLCSEPREVSLDWVIVGGESGPGARPMHPDWARRLRDDCRAAGVAFFFKQWGEWLPAEPDAQPPFWNWQDGSMIDGHLLPDLDDPETRGWDDGLGYVADGLPHAIFRRTGKKGAGRLLDGRTWDEVPG